MAGCPWVLAQERANGAPASLQAKVQTVSGDFLHSWMGRTQAMESACMYGLRWTERVCTYIGPMTPVLRLTRRDLNSSDLSHIAAAWGPDPIRGRHLLCQDLCQAGEPEAGRGFILVL